VRARELVQVPEQALALALAPARVLGRVQVLVLVLVLARVQALELVRALEQARERALVPARVGVSQPVPKPDRVRVAVTTLRHGICAFGPGRSTSRRTMPAIRLFRSKS
jgi:hypothetical protein